jgi:hypothetical protein
MMDDEVTPEASAICVLLSHIEAVFAERGYLDCDISDEAYDEIVEDLVEKYIVIFKE